MNEQTLEKTEGFEKLRKEIQTLYIKLLESKEWTPFLTPIQVFRIIIVQLINIFTFTNNFYANLFLICSVNLKI